ncbi:MAG: branched-chain amino acid ABC transporter permease [Stellaceae bacterium]
MTGDTAFAFFRRANRWSPFEVLFWLALIGLYFVPGVNLVLFTQCVIWGIFALGLDVLMGYRGIPSLGHAAFLGLGAYVAGFLGKYGTPYPLVQLVLAGLAAGLLGLAVGRFIVGLTGVGLLTVTLGLNLILYSVVGRIAITGGDDGLQGVVIAPIAGLFPFDYVGQTGYLYSLAIAFVMAMAVRALVKAPYGLALEGARENSRRMIVLGAPIKADAVKALTISAAISGVAGALITQTTQFVSPGTLSFERSADVLVILVIGGLGQLYGGFVGSFLFLYARDYLSNVNPVYWYFWVGALLVVLMCFFRRGILPTAMALYGRLQTRRVARG